MHTNRRSEFWRQLNSAAYPQATPLTALSRLPTHDLLPLTAPSRLPATHPSRLLLTAQAAPATHALSGFALAAI
jgi:hypothetical protein